MPSGLVLISSDDAPTARRRLLLRPGSCGVVKRESLRAGADRGVRETADLEDERLALLCLSTDERLVVVRMSKRTPVAIRSAARRDGRAATRLTLEGVGDAAAVPLEDCVVRRAPPSVLSSLVPPLRPPRRAVGRCPPCRPDLSPTSALAVPSGVRGRRYAVRVPPLPVRPRLASRRLSRPAGGTAARLARDAATLPPFHPRPRTRPTRVVSRRRARDVRRRRGDRRRLPDEDGDPAAFGLHRLALPRARRGRS